MTGSLKSPAGGEIDPTIVREPLILDPSESIVTIIQTTPVLISQGNGTIVQTHTYKLIGDQTLTYRLIRSSRTGGEEFVITYKPKNSKHAWFMELENDWSIDSKLDQNTALISLQGVANMNAPRLYFIYPDDWDFNFTPNVLEFLESGHDYTFDQLYTLKQAVASFREDIQGYIV